MTQQPFSRPGAIDPSGLDRPGTGGAQPPAGSRPPGGPGGAATGGAAPTGGDRSSYALGISEENLETVLGASVTAPIVLVFYSPTRAPESAAMSDDVVTAI